MNSLFKGIALFVAIACFVWVGVIWRWQSTQHDMSEHDIGVYLIGLPLVLFALALAARWAWQGVASPASQGAQTPAENAAAAAAPVEADAGTTGRTPAAMLLGAHLRCAAGDDAVALLAAATAGTPRPDLDPSLRDADGLPVMSARIAALESTDLSVEQALQRRQGAAPQGSATACREEVVRALSALAPVIEAALADPAPWARLLANPEASAGLRVVPAWPADWSDAERALAQGWLEQALLASAVLPAAAIACESGAGETPAWALGHALRLLEHAHAQGHELLVLVCACHSALGEESILRLQAAGRLFGSRMPRAPVAGEAAAALLLAPTAWPAAAAAGAAAAGPVLLQAPALARRDQPVDAAGRTARSSALPDCVARSLAASGLAPSAVQAVAHDADDHTPRAAEALAALLGPLEHLDPAADTRSFGALCGQTGAVAPLLATALAAALATEREGPCLALSVDDARWRLALVVLPADLDTSPTAPPTT